MRCAPRWASPVPTPLRPANTASLRIFAKRRRRRVTATPRSCKTRHVQPARLYTGHVQSATRAWLTVHSGQSPRALRQRPQDTRVRVVVRSQTPVRGERRQPVHRERGAHPAVRQSRTGDAGRAARRRDRAPHSRTAEGVVLAPPGRPATVHAPVPIRYGEITSRSHFTGRRSRGAPTVAEQSSQLNGATTAESRPPDGLTRPHPVGGHVDDRWTNVQCRGITVAALWTSC